MSILGGWVFSYGRGTLVRVPGTNIRLCVRAGTRIPGVGRRRGVDDGGEEPPLRHLLTYVFTY